ncbi:MULTISPECIES: DUF1120 domain-containing protein [unclassified Serratia (in: enterobacteria)]|uniref:DUF1120 domain-containing protein n=1 Tax=unclassified Serratia (in: enterobacteria) TaxID=2647522 RepID=UPI00307615EA
MKKHLIALAVLPSVMLTVANAQAAETTAELKVQGSIDIPTCTVAAPDNGVYDLGKLSSSLVSASATTSLAPMTKTWSVTCDSQTYLSITSTDNRAATASQTAPNLTNFGLGYINGTGKIGYYTVSMRNGFVDGVARSIYYGAKGSSTLTAAPAGIGYFLGSTNRYGWSDTNAVPVAGRVFTADMRIIPVLASTATMNGPVTDSSMIDGSMTINFSFAI